MSAPLFFLTVDIANIVSAVLLGAWVIGALPQSRNAQLIALLSLSVVCHIVLGRADYGRWIAPPYRIYPGGWYPVLNLARNAAPGLFMILIHRLFADRRAMPTWLLGLFAVQLLLEALPQGFSRQLTQVVPTLLQLLFAAFALYWTLGYWRGDLVESRRRVRALVAVILAVDVVASSLLLRVVIPPDTLANYQAHLLLSLANLAIVLFLLLRLRRLDWLEEARRTPRAHSADAAPLLALLERERIWRQPGLTLPVLAARLGLPEYRLRALIHEQLGHRNFNALLHEYRIREACARLADPAMRRTPILTIALSVGYNSVNTFNRGFREVMGTTPSAWRAGDAAGPDGNLAPKTE